jgi:hypothetical protein
MKRLTTLNRPARRAGMDHRGVLQPPQSLRSSAGGGHFGLGPSDGPTPMPVIDLPVRGVNVAMVAENTGKHDIDGA